MQCLALLRCCKLVLGLSPNLPGSFLFRVCMFSLYLCWFSGYTSSLPQCNKLKIRSSGYPKLAIGYLATRVCKSVQPQCRSQTWINWEGCFRMGIQQKANAKLNMWTMDDLLWQPEKKILDWKNWSVWNSLWMACHSCTLVIHIHNLIVEKYDL